MVSTPTRFKAAILSKEFVPTMDRDLSSQCGQPVRALRLRTSVTHHQPETADPYNSEEWLPVIPSEANTSDFITDLFVGYTDREIHLSGSSFSFDLSLLGKLWVWAPSSQIRINYRAYNKPRMSSTKPGARVLHQCACPTHLQLVDQNTTHTDIPTITTAAICAGC